VDGLLGFASGAARGLVFVIVIIERLSRMVALSVDPCPWPELSVRSSRCSLGGVSTDEARGDQIADLPVGSDLFSAQVISESVKAAGFNVELREMTPEGVALARFQQHRLLVQAADLDAVRQLVDNSFPTAG
jgi:hypothetical protein